MTSLAEGEARFQSLTAAHRAAVSAGDTAKADKILTDLEALGDEVLNAAFQSKVNQFVANARVKALTIVVDERSRATDEISDLAAAFDGAAAEANEAGKDLFFNKLAETLGGIEKTIKAFKARASQIRGALESLNKPQDVQELIDNVETVKGVLDGLKSDLQSIKDNFAG